MIDWVAIIREWGLVLVFLTAFIIFLRQLLKSTAPANQSTNTQSAPAVQIQRSGNIDEITAAISAAVNEYRKNN
jgi:Na+-transporting methylmalonyl-CoA/oxaloacetate decarboxylase gamma subunit